jgi:hypothetical protein
MSKVVRFMRPFAIAMEPDYLILLFSDQLHCLLMFKVVRFFKPFAIAMAPDYPILLFSE